MPRNWLSARVELLSGAPAGQLWPTPGRVLLVGPRHTFRDLAEAIEVSFARWDRAHLWEFTLADGRRIAEPDPEDDEPVEDAGRSVVARTVEASAALRYVFDFGDRWVHRCTVLAQKVDPVECVGVVPEQPVAYVGWGALPDQYGRRWEDDDGGTSEPPPPVDPDPMLSGAWPQPVISERSRLTAGDLPDLRGATARLDRAAVRALVLGCDAGPVLQHAGDALLAVGVDGLEAIARSVERRLRERDDEGDVELADSLAGRLGDPVPTLRPVPVDLDEVAELMSGDPHQNTGGSVDLQTGETWPDDILDAFDEDDRPDVDAEPDRWWRVDCEGSRATWQDRHDFASRLPRGAFRDRLLDALEGRGAFGRFAGALGDAPDVLTEWHAFGAERERGRARALMAANGYTPVAD